MEKIAVTGYNGFIGKHLVQALLKAGHIVYPIDRNFKSVKCDKIYHLACPSTTEKINEDPCGVIDTIVDVTRRALDICPTAKFINASSIGAGQIDLDNNPQNAYNIAKRCMEVYLQFSRRDYVNYRLPAVYGPGMHDDFFIKRCVDGRAHKPTYSATLYSIAHIDDVVDALINLTPLKQEEITLGEIYEQFNSGRRGLYRSTSNQRSV